MLPDLSITQYQLVQSALNLTIAVMGGAALLFVLLRRQVAPSYQMALGLMAVVVAMAAYHYFRIYDNWSAAYALKDAVYAATGAPLNYSYRYADWLGNVPLILSAVVLVLDLGRDKSRSLVTRLVLAAALMIVTGYIGEIERLNLTVRGLWGLVSTVPFLYIMYVLWSELSGALSFESPRVQAAFGQLRWLLLLSWCFYPVVYTFPMFQLSGALVTVGIQVGNSIADIAAKAVFGLVIYAIARAKTEDAARLEQSPVPLMVVAASQPPAAVPPSHLPRL